MLVSDHKIDLQRSDVKWVVAEQALFNLDERALPEWAAFAATLARRLAALLPQHLVSLGDPVWQACVDSFLVKAVDIDSQVSAVRVILDTDLYVQYLHL